MKIDWDQDNNEIKVGEAVFKAYCNFKSRDAWVKEVYHKNGLDYPFGYHPKEKNKIVADTLGCSSVVLYKHFKKLLWKAFIVPHKDLLYKIAYPAKGVSLKALNNIISHKDKLVEVQRDGLYHLLPVVALTGKSPQELKAEYGKDWKKLANNSLHKNKLLCKRISSKKLIEYAEFPTTLIEFLGEVDRDALKFLQNNYKGSWKHPHKYQQDLMLLGDAKRMSQKLGEKVNPLWSSRRLKEEHDRMSHAISVLKNSPAPMPVLKDISAKHLFTENLHAKLLISAKDIGDEGRKMGHCVGGYVGEVRSGAYLVYSIMRGSMRSSTLGISIVKDKDGNKSFKFSQHYGRYNAQVTNKEEKELAQSVLDKLNEKVAIAA